MKTTKQHFELFKKECQKWIDRFELNNYIAHYEWKDLGTANAKSISNTDYNATFGLNTEIEPFGNQVNSFVKGLAKHEVIHCLLGRVDNCAFNRFINENELTEAMEELTRKLEKIII